jgi:hypothetical protein
MAAARKDLTTEGWLEALAAKAVQREPGLGTKEQVIEFLRGKAGTPLGDLTPGQWNALDELANVGVGWVMAPGRLTPVEASPEEDPWL